MSEGGENHDIEEAGDDTDGERLWSSAGGPVSNDSNIIANDAHTLELSNIMHRVLFSLAVVFFCMFTCVFLVHGKDWHELSDSQLAELKRLFCIYCLCMTSYLLVQGSDPGYLEAHLGDNCQAFQMVEEERAVVLDQPGTVNMRKKVAEKVGDSSDNEDPDYCRYCQVIKPVRSHHCRTCNRCVHKFDHHCHFLRTCIGERNHCRFYCFLCIHTYGLVYAWLTCVYSIVSSNAAIFLFVFLSGLVLFVCSLLGFHTWLVLSSTTSLECGRGSSLSYMKNIGEFDLPFSTCLFVDVFDFFCYRDAVMQWLWRQPYRAWVVCGRLARRLKGICRYSDDSVPEYSGDLSVWSSTDVGWKPKKWPRPGPIIKDSDDICRHPWQNKYYSCC
jgi:hypothetical protein